MENVKGRHLPYCRVVERDTYFLDFCRRKNVLHIGCTDAPFTESKWNAGTLLHSKLDHVAQRTVGIDVDSDSVKWLTDRGLDVIHTCDASNVDSFLESIAYAPEVVVAGPAHGVL